MDIVQQLRTAALHANLHDECCVAGLTLTSGANEIERLRNIIQRYHESVVAYDHLSDDDFDSAFFEWERAKTVLHKEGRRLSQTTVA